MSPLNKEQKNLAKEIADKLGETEKKPLRQIERIIELTDDDIPLQLLAATLEIEEQGGMMTVDGSRRRTPGGVFFHLARERLPEEVIQQIFFAWLVKAKKRNQMESRFPEFIWEERKSVFENVWAEKGKVSNVRINLVGRPGEVERRQHLVIFSMQDELEHKELVLPTGIPDAIHIARTYNVLVSAKQWDAVEKAIQNPKDELIVEGFCGYDDEVEGMVVFTTYITTRRLQRKERKQAKVEDQQQAARANKQPEKRDRGAAPQKQDKSSKAPTRKMPEVVTPMPEIQIDIPDGMPQDAAQKLRELHAAAATFRHKIANIEAKPAEQQFGLEMTQKLLTNIEKQIAALEKQYAK